MMDAIETIADHFETTGELRRPLVTMHTKSDPLIPYTQAEQYSAKVEDAERNFFYRHIPVDAYGHCLFNPLELVEGVKRLELLNMDVQ